MRLIQGIGVNDANYTVTGTKDGKRTMCPYYRAWTGMLARCQDGRRPSYVNCKVVQEWHSFSNFKAWMETQDWEGKALDKDVLIEGNKVYSPETCVFVTTEVNSFLTEKKSNGGNLPLGVAWHGRDEKFVARVWNTKGERKLLGYFSSADEAHLAYKIAKWELAKELAAKQTDRRVADAILKRYEYKG